MGMYAVDTADAAELGEFRDAARGGRTAARTRRHQLSQGKQALNGASTSAGENQQAAGAGAVPAAPSGQVEPNGTQGAREQGAVPTDAVEAAHFGRTVSRERRRQMSQGKQAMNRAGALPAAENLDVNGAGPAPAPNAQGDPNGTRAAQEERAAATDAVASAHFGRTVSKERRRQLSQGKQALMGAGAESVQANRASAPPAANGHGADPTDAVASAHFGRTVSKERRRQLSQGKQALMGAGAPPALENVPVENAASGLDRTRAQRAEATPVGNAGISGPQGQGQVRYVPKVIASPTHGGQHVTGVRIGPGVQVTGGEPGASHPVSGTQYFPADGPAPAPGAGVKVGLMRTPQGLVVSGTAVRGNVPITGDEAGEHLLITGEADQRLDDDLTPRTGVAYQSAQFPRRADPHGATAVGGRLRVQSPTGPALENSDGGLAVTGTAVGRSGRVTGNEAGACRPITGDQYQNLYSTECGAIGGGTAPAAHLDRTRLDPVTATKVTVAQTWRGQQVTGPSLEHRPNVTGDEPGVCRPVTGTPYQGPSGMFGRCEPGEVDPATDRLGPRLGGVAVTGDLPMQSKLVTGIQRGARNDITGSSYYGDMRPAEPAAADWARGSFPVAQARRLAGRESAKKDIEVAPPASCVPGRITGAFAISADKVTGNSEFLFRPRTVQAREGTRTPITGEGRTDGRAITGSAAAWTSHGLVTGTEGYIAAGRNPTEGGGDSNAWAGARRFKDLATPGAPNENARVTGRVGGSPKDGVRVTVSGGAQG